MEYAARATENAVTLRVTRAMVAIVRLLVLAVLYVGAAHATLVTLDADDFVAGTDISNVNPSVALSDGAGSPVFAARFECPEVPSLLGANVFSSRSGAGCHGWSSQVGGPDPADQAGYAFVAAFSDPVDYLRILFLNSGYRFPFAAEYSIYDAERTLLSAGILAAPLGELVTLEINQENIGYIDVGGLSSIGALSIDHLSFHIVPEPATIWLSIAGLGMLCAMTKFAPRSVTGSGIHRTYRSARSELWGRADCSVSN